MGLPSSLFFTIYESFENAEDIMARCELTGKSPVVKNLVSHSNIKTKSVAMPNVQRKRIFSPTLNQSVTLKVATSTLKSMEHSGGFDKYILNQPTAVLSKRATAVQSRIRRKISKPAPSKA
jgi:large subunit ribosomal protein L28